MTSRQTSEDDLKPETRVIAFVREKDGSLNAYYDFYERELVNMAVVAGGQATLMWLRSWENKIEFQNPQLQNIDPAIFWDAREVLVIDIRDSVILWSGTGDFIHTPRLLNYLFSKSWFRWNAYWAPEGYLSVLKYLGFDLPEKLSFFSVDKRDEIIEIDIKTDERFVTDDLAEGFNLLTLKTLSGEILIVPTLYSIFDVSKTKPQELIDAIKLKGSNVNAIERVFDTHKPGFGVHIDESSRTVSWWAMWSSYKDEKDFDELWSGWSVRGLGDGYEFHEREIGFTGADSTPNVLGNLGQDIVSSLSYFEFKNATLHRHKEIYDLVQICENNWLRYGPPFEGMEGVPRSGSNVEYFLQLALENLIADREIDPARFLDGRGFLQQHKIY